MDPNHAVTLSLIMGGWLGSGLFQAGSFGGTYFRPIQSSVTQKTYGPEVWRELPSDWLKGLNIKTQVGSASKSSSDKSCMTPGDGLTVVLTHLKVASSIYDAQVNKYKAKCGGSLEMWESSGWIKEQDPYGWFQWYCRFYQVSVN